MEFDEAEQQRMARAMMEESLDQVAGVIGKHCQLDPKEWPATRLKGWTSDGLDKAVTHNLTSANDIIGYLILRYTISPRFDEFPVVKKFLARTDLPPTRRIEQMLLELPLGIWEIVQRRMS